MKLDQAGARLLEPLVSADSPSGDEDRAADVLSRHLDDWGLVVRRDEAGNVIASRPDADPTAPTVLCVGHLDTVPGRLPVTWEGDVLHGRGAVDAKGPLTAHALALASLPDDVDLDVRLVAAVGEEADSRGARHLREAREAPAGLLIAEPTGTDTIGLGYKGRLLADVETRVTPSHPGEPSPTASERVIDALDTLTERTSNPDRDVGVDETTLRVTELASQRSAREERARATVDVRYPGGIPDVGAADDALGDEVRIDVTEALPGVQADPRNPLATALRGALRANGREPRAARKTGTSDWNVLAEAWSCPAAAYGPGDPALDHTPEEHLAIDDLVAAARVLREGLQRLPADRLSSPPRSAGPAQEQPS